ncbi:MAG TPA: hypothetical protein DCE42_21420 [Myxococcales bacterium]|nr:hypothetical protein [Deltaproteobacteria bacterium]MBU49434.1 hypothetical protein [Deltaproteobacteria bacterium]HAA57340.1 hypothetical protein [Myxococcales bacterium]
MLRKVVLWSVLALGLSASVISVGCTAYCPDLAAEYALTGCEGEDTCKVTQQGCNVEFTCEKALQFCSGLAYNETLNMSCTDQNGERMQAIVVVKDRDTKVVNITFARTGKKACQGTLTAN